MRRRSRKSYLVIGLGRFGSSLAMTLSRLGHEVLGIDIDMEVLEEFKDVVHEVQQMDATNVRALREVSVRDFDNCIVGRGEDLGESIMITMNLRDLGAKHIIAKAVTEQHARILKQLGADEVVFPERDMGEHLAHTLSSPYIYDFLRLAPGVSVIEIDSPVMVHHKSLGELELRARYGITVLGVLRGDDFDPNPNAKTVIEPGDKLVVFGATTAVEEFVSS